MTWTDIVRADWQRLLILLVAFICFAGAFSRVMEGKYPAAGLLAHLQNFGGSALLTLYFFIAPTMAYFVSLWKKRTATWALFTFWPGPVFLLILLLLPEAKSWPIRRLLRRAFPRTSKGKGVWIQVQEEETGSDPIFAKGFEDFFLTSKLDLVPFEKRGKARDWAIYVVIGIAFLGLLIWFLLLTRPVPLQ